MNWSRWLNWFNREKIVLLIASLALTLGAIYPWYRLPPQALDKFGTDLSLANAGRVLAAIFALLGFVFALWSRPGRAPRLPFWSGLIAVLLFPYLITTWSPPVAFLAASYYDQGLRVTSHVENNFPDVQSQWKHNISLDESKPITSFLPLVIKNNSFFQMSSWDQIVEAFCYKNSFWQCIGRGWSFSIIGVVIGLSAIYLEADSKSFDLFLKDMVTVLPFLALLILILLFSIGMPNILNYQLDAMLAKGQYHQVLVTSQNFKFWYPILECDVNFLKVIAEAGFYSNKLQLNLSYFYKGLQSYQLKNFLEAETYFQQSLAINRNVFLVRGYLATTMLNQGVEYFNNHLTGAAADRFEQVLRIFPGHVEALYYLMLARVINGEFEKSALVAKQIIETQQYFQMPSLALLGQAHLHLAWASYHNSDIEQAWEQYRKSVDKSAWK